MKKSYKFGMLLVFLLQVMSANIFAQVTLIDPATDGGFEMGATLAANGWTEMNATQPNKWFNGTIAVPATGTNSAYISSSATGATYDYNINAASVVSFYKDFTIPAGQSKMTISFKWKAMGESCCDFLRVWLAPTTF